MTETELRELLDGDEIDRLELTESTDNSDQSAEAVCAFANDLPGHGKAGHLIIGVDNRRRSVGLRVTDALLLNLGGLRGDGNIQPLPELHLEKVATSEGDVAVVTVQPSDLPPVRYKGLVCIRVGPRRGYATEPEERKLIERRVAHARTFDAQPCLGSGLSDLSLPLFLNGYRQQAIAPDVLDENRRPADQQLASLRFFDLQRSSPTHAGILLFGLDVRGWLPGAYVQFLHVAGTTLASDVLNERELQGDLLTVLRDLDAQVDAQLSSFPASTSRLRERTVESYPRVAVRELVMNAVMHHDYASTAPLRITWLADRVEIQSPGGLYGEASPENFPRQTSYRNPVVAEALKALGYVNRYGRGVLRAQDALAANESAEAAFEFDAGYVLATIRKPS